MTDSEAPPPRVAIVTVSSSRARAGRRPEDDAPGGGEPAADAPGRAPAADASGDALAGFAERLGWVVAGRDLVADDRGEIEDRLRHWSDADGCDAILTTGGTGLTADDVTPEATAAVVDRPVPGIAEAMRAASAPHTPHWMLSRATAGLRGRTLIVNFPGSPKAVAEVADALAPALPHAVAQLRDAAGVGHDDA